MALVPKLELRQGQQLVMTPQLQQAIRLLQLSNVELCSFVEAEVERNPLLEREEVGPEPGPETARKNLPDQEPGVRWGPSDAPSAGTNTAREEGEPIGTPPTNGADHDAAGWGGRWGAADF
jgi:RNA polymerase sigma-54 factor